MRVRSYLYRQVNWARRKATNSMRHSRVAINEKFSFPWPEMMSGERDSNCALVRLVRLDVARHVGCG